MTTQQSFESMLRDLAAHFGAKQIERVVAYYDRGAPAFEVGFLLHMQNGEYWFATNHLDTNTRIFRSLIGAPVTGNHWTLFQYYPPVPSFSSLPTPATAEEWFIQTQDGDLNQWLRSIGGGSNIFMQMKDE